MAAPTQPCRSAARYIATARGGSCSGRLASQRSRSGYPAQIFARPLFAASQNPAPRSLLTS